MRLNNLFEKIIKIYVGLNFLVIFCFLYVAYFYNCGDFAFSVGRFLLRRNPHPSTVGSQCRYILQYCSYSLQYCRYGLFYSTAGTVNSTAGQSKTLQVQATVQQVQSTVLSCRYCTACTVSRNPGAVYHTAVKVYRACRYSLQCCRYSLK
jgi:hypothetical protein